MKVDEKDLVPFKASEMKIGGYFYLRDEQDQAEFYLCQITEDDLAIDSRKTRLSKMTAEFSKKGLLFKNRNRAWEPLMK